ncbi:TPR domain-containing protein [Colletotrichum truncatum]|uniref:TPR domain-containing protein n=1 Tax=Colletotrichum truncatum TaxID=5467 RepID=A0ACC3ZBP0_COLTU|nr:TPR domain-containing protein [Colletotrichum truncatum]KAF6783778.1 TPR domain-containing protein [Colletotrichum truncatum]
MQEFLYEQFNLEVSKSTLSRHLHAAGWTRKKAHIIASQRNPELRYDWLYRIRRYHPEQLIFVDESGVDKNTGRRRTGWAPKGLTPTRSVPLERGQRIQLLPALAIDGIVDLLVYTGSTNGEGFSAWIQQLLLPKCGIFPGPKSVIIMDIASFHRQGDIRQACEAAGVRLEFLPPYSPDFNPIEEYFGDLKKHVKKTFRTWNTNELDERDFAEFLRDCALEVGQRLPQIAGHFRNSYINFDGTQDIFCDAMTSSDMYIEAGGELNPPLVVNSC